MAGRLGEVPDDVSLRTHRGGLPATSVRVVHREAVMVFGDGYDEVGSCLTEQLRPPGRVEGIGGELWDEVLVAEPGPAVRRWPGGARTPAGRTGTCCARTTHCRRRGRSRHPSG